MLRCTERGGITETSSSAPSATWIGLFDVISRMVLRLPVPERFKGWAAQPAELHRSITQWYPRYEQQVLGSPATRR